MKNIKSKLKFQAVVLLVCLAVCSVLPVRAQVTLSGNSYTQNFNTLSNGLPLGWTVRTNATATSLGQTASFPTVSKSWADGTGEFGNCPSLTNNAGILATGSESSATQGTFTNRILAVRQTGAFGDPGAAFVFQIANTVGFSNLAFSVNLNLVRTNGYSTTWTIQYSVSDSPTVFSTLGTYPDPGVVGVSRQSFPLGTDVDNQSANVWIRVVALSASTGSGLRDTFGLDDFTLTYEGSVATAVPLFIRADGTNAVLTWNDPDFALQSAPEAAGVYTNLNGATSPFTNAMDGSARFFRLIEIE